MRAKDQLNEADLFFSNKSLNALVHEAEAEAAGGTPPIDLALVARERWPEYVEEEVLPHPIIQKFLDGHHGPFTVDEVQNLEIAMEKAYGVEPPLCIVMELGMARDGRPWQYIKTPNLTGFSLQLKGT